MKKVIALMLAGTMCLSLSAFANEDLEARIAALEERVAALETQIGIAPEGVSAAAEQKAEEIPELTAEDVGMVAKGHSLVYKRCEVGKDMWKNDCVILYFDYANESGETSSAGNAFILKAYQHDVQIDFTSVMNSEWYTELRSGAAPIEVAFPFKISDTSEIIVNIRSFADYQTPDVEFTVSLE